MLSRSIRSRPNRLCWTLAALLAASPAFLSSAARAADGDEAREARAHYKQGEDAFQAGRFEEAFRQWQRGYELSARPLFLLNMAHAQRRRGDLRIARSLYQRFLLVEPQTKLRRDIETLLRDIDSSLANDPAGGPPSRRPPDGDVAMGEAVAVSPAPVAVASGDEAEIPDRVQSLSPPPSAPLPPLVASSLAPPPPAPEPRVLARPAEASLRDGPVRPAYKKWWFWTGVGALLATGVAAVVLLRDEPYTRSGSLGTVGTAP